MSGCRRAMIAVVRSKKAIFLMQLSEDCYKIYQIMKVSVYSMKHKKILIVFALFMMSHLNSITLELDQEALKYHQDKDKNITEENCLEGRKYFMPNILDYESKKLSSNIRFKARYAYIFQTIASMGLNCVFSYKTPYEKLSSNFKTKFEEKEIQVEINKCDEYCKRRFDSERARLKDDYSDYFSDYYHPLLSKKTTFEGSYEQEHRYIKDFKNIKLENSSSTYSESLNNILSKSASNKLAKQFELQQIVLAYKAEKPKAIRTVLVVTAVGIGAYFGSKYLGSS